MDNPLIQMMHGAMGLTNPKGNAEIYQKDFDNQLFYNSKNIKPLYDAYQNLKKLLDTIQTKFNINKMQNKISAKKAQSSAIPENKRQEEKEGQQLDEYLLMPALAAGLGLAAGQWMKNRNKKKWEQGAQEGVKNAMEELNYKILKAEERITNFEDMLSQQGIILESTDEGLISWLNSPASTPYDNLTAKTGSLMRKVKSLTARAKRIYKALNGKPPRKRKTTKQTTQNPTATATTQTSQNTQTQTPTQTPTSTQSSQAKNTGANQDDNVQYFDMTPYMNTNESKQTYTSDYTHFAVNKVTGKIAEAWNYRGLKPEFIREHKDILFAQKLIAEGMDPKEYVIKTRKSLNESKINPENINKNWL